MVSDLKWETEIVRWKNSLCLTGQKIKHTLKKIGQQVVLACTVLGDSESVKSSQKFSSEVWLWSFLVVPRIHWISTCFWGAIPNSEHVVSILPFRSLGRIAKWCFIFVCTQAFPSTFQEAPCLSAALPTRVAQVECWVLGCLRCYEISTLETENCLKILWLLIVRLEGPSESNSTPRSISILWRAVRKREFAESGTWSQLVQPSTWSRHSPGILFIPNVVLLLLSGHVYEKGLKVASSRVHKLHKWGTLAEGLRALAYTQILTDSWLALWLWQAMLTFRNLHFLICKMG